MRTAGLRRGSLPAIVSVFTLLAVLAGPQEAPARGLITGFADGLYADPSASTRNLWLDRTAAARSKLVRINVLWSQVAASRPTSPTNPADPAYDFSVADRAVRSASQHGRTVLITVYSAPAWAEGPNRPSSAAAGSWRPDPGEFRAFARALATRYSGSFLDPSSLGTLPRVRYYQALNEPNLATYLSPQWKGRRAKSPFIYRHLLNAFYAGVKGVHSRNVVVTAGTAPYGDSPGGDRMRPLLFWRRAFCLRGRRALHRGNCPKARQARFDILAHHPINTSGPPTQSAIHPDDASTPDMAQVRRVLRAAERRHTVRPRGRHAFWATEMWWESNPPDPQFGYRPKVHARFVEQTLYLIWKGGASVAINLQIRDAPNKPGVIHDHTGIFYGTGTPKPAYRAWRFPFVAEKLKRGRIRIWGKAPGQGKVRIQRRVGRRWRALRSLRTRPSRIFTGRLRLRRGRLRARFGGETSLSWIVR